MVYVTTYKLALQLLSKKGVKVAIQCGHDGPFVYAQKNDFILMLNKRAKGNKGPTNYDGGAEYFEFTNNVLHVYTGQI